MLNDADTNVFSKICLVTGYTDLRRGIDGLSAMIQSSYELDPYETNVLFLFCGRRLDRIKGLLWEGDGFLLLYKRLEKGKSQWPRNEQEVLSLTSQQFRWLMEGLTLYQPKAIPACKPRKTL